MPVLAKWQLRGVRRYNVQAAAFFSWKGGSQVGEGMTRDISRQAAFVLARNCPAVGIQLRIDVLLPSLREKVGCAAPWKRCRVALGLFRFGNQRLRGGDVYSCGTHDAMDILLKADTDWGRTQ